MIDERGEVVGKRSAVRARKAQEVEDVATHPQAGNWTLSHRYSAHVSALYATYHLLDTIRSVDEQLYNTVLDALEKADDD